MNHITQDKGPDVTEFLTLQDTFQPIPCLISCAGVAQRCILLSYTRKTGRKLVLSASRHM